MAVENLPNTDQYIYHGDKVHINEATALERRTEKVAAFFRKQWGLNHINEENCPKVAFTFSGGGMRALMMTVSALDIMKKEDILDTTSYISCLSGSTWAIAPWLLRSHHGDYNVFYPTSDHDFFRIGEEAPKKMKPTTAHLTKVYFSTFMLNCYQYVHDLRGSILENTTLPIYGDF